MEEILQSVRSEASPGSELSAKLDEILAVMPQLAESPGRTPVPTVFMSSTIDDLGDHREKAKDAANRAEFLPVLSQYFPASQHKRALDLCLERAAQADVLVVIVGHRYGFVPPDNNKDEKSITWLECEAAGPDTAILAFLVDPAFPGLDATKEQQRLMDALAKGDDITKLAAEVQRNIRKLEEFRRWVSSDEKKFLCKTFTNPDHLALEVYHALVEWRKRNMRFATTLGPVERPPANPTQYLKWLSNHTGFINIRGLQVGKREARVSTEAEWERAACGGEARKYPWGDEIDPSRANYLHEDGLQRDTPVGLYPLGASPEGLHDMTGNVWEWCADWHDWNYYAESPRRNPQGPESGVRAVLRGGSWVSNSDVATCACRMKGARAGRNRSADSGFRCARR